MANLDLKAFIRDVPDFPKPGVLFRDISPLLADPTAFRAALDGLAKLNDPAGFDAVAGIESRGFIFGAALAALLGKGFLPIRKAGKLPPPTHQVRYALEYGEAALELRAGQGRLLLLDDVLATGGTLEAARTLALKAGYEVTAMAVLIDLPFLNAYRFRGAPVPSLFQY